MYKWLIIKIDVFKIIPALRMTRVQIFFGSDPTLWVLVNNALRDWEPL